MKSVRIKELRLRHYRAFSDARLVLDDVTFLVGRNGAGKSTLMDGLSFLSEAVTDSLSTALERRGNLEGIRQRQPGRGARYDVWIAARLSLEGPFTPAIYGFRLSSDVSKSTYIVKQEVLSAGGSRIAGFERDSISFKTNVESIQPPLDPESLVLPLIAGANEDWKRILETLRAISVHQFSPQAIRNEPKIGSEERLSRDGSNAGDVLKHIKPKDRSWIEERLSAAIPGIRGVKATARVGRRVIVFQQEGEANQAYDFDASMMSDGTVRSLGILLALRQTPRPSIVLLDEIEDSLHPYAHGVLLDAIGAVSEEFPIVLSTHNPEILSHPVAEGERIRIVQWEQGASKIYRLSEQVLEGLRPPQNVGRLLRSNALWTEDLPSITPPEMDFFNPYYY
jgi:predicted ATPase